ncbi:MAG: helix-turn-helix transcriptional regulator [Alicyclobacillus herbarius]|nr:helix-turn-helix transcriptional regulator [Alicyclobacillus herbarius]
MTLEQVHERTGISVSHLSAIENGTRPNPSFRNVLKLAQTYQVPVCYFSEDGPCAAHRDAVPNRFATPQAPEPDGSPPSPGMLARDDAWALIASEQSGPYLALARRLMDANALSEDTSEVLQVIAEFIREQRPPRELETKPSDSDSDIG